jgi:late competence protein required for DNA uptake (superfamily II DNA/RNA helicase)
MGRCYSGQHVCCFGLYHVDGQCIKAYTYLHLTTQRVGCYSLTDFTSKKMKEVITKCMHISDNNKQNESQGPLKLFKVYPVIQHTNNKFQNLYLSKHNPVTDKSLVQWKGNLSFRQYTLRLQKRMNSSS